MPLENSREASSDFQGISALCFGVCNLRNQLKNYAKVEFMDLVALIKSFNQAVDKVPALRRLWGVLAIIFLLSIVNGLGLNPEQAVFGGVIVISLLFLLVLFTVFANSKSFDVTKQLSVIVWTITILFSIGLAGLLGFYFWDAVVRRIQPPTQTEKPSEAIPPLVMVSIVKKTVQVVNAKVGDDDGKNDLYKYVAPSGCIIQSHKFNEISKAGSSAYSLKLSTDSTLEVAWSMQSEQKKVAGVVVDTKPAWLELSMDVELKCTS